MPQKTPRYIMDYFKRGSLYSGRSDFRRFTTLDYNMDSYVGITGVGIISGWTIEQINGLQVQVLPGKGVIQGFAVESPYVYKKRSEMVIPEREAEIIVTDPDEVPEPDMTDAERTEYIAVVQDYDPTYNPVGPIENAFVKAVTPKRIDLFDDSDNYIYAERQSNKTPYPPLADYPPPPGDDPSVRDYPDYNDYLVAKATYDSAVQLVEDYEWRNSSENHFTSVNFRLTTAQSSLSNRTLLAKVVTRNGTVREIDLRNVDSLDNMASQIEKFAKQVIEDHNHGGTGAFDPPKVKLETDVRPAMLTKRLSNNVVRYTALSSDKTSVTDGHQHSYYVDGSGNGYTVGVYGSDVVHFHKITNYAVGTQEFTPVPIDDHGHTIPNEGYSDWTVNSQFEVYVNNAKVGDETTITSNPSNNTFELSQEIGHQYKLYSSTFDVTMDDGSIESYTFSLRTFSVLSFMIKMQIDFSQRYSGNVSIVGADGTTVSTQHPFVFPSSDGDGFVGLADLVDQSNIAEQFLTKVNDTFTFTPNAARNVTIILEDVPSQTIYNVKIEILGNSEVTGVLSTGNILYINASKIVLGKFDLARIPFIDHIGRIDEPCLPYQQYVVSSDGIKYDVVPSTTGVTEGHSHDVFVDADLSGITEQVFIDEDPVFYGTGSDGQAAYLIAHIHGISEGTIQDADASGLTAWRNDINGTNVSSTTHTHELVLPEAGDPKTIYSIQENKDGHIYVGTANGFFMIPDDTAYLYVINGESFYLLGDDLWDLLIEAKAKYEDRTGKPLSVTTGIYGSQIASAISELSSEGDSYLMVGVTDPATGEDEIMIKRLGAFQLPNFTYVTQKYPFEIKADEVINGVEFQFSSTGAVITDFNQVTEDNYEDVVAVYTVMRFFNDTPIWSIALRDDFAPNPEGAPDGDPTGVAVEDLFVCGSDVLSRYRNLDDDFYNEWRSPNIPSHIGGLRRVVKDDGHNLWIPTNRGLVVSRSYQNGAALDEVVIPGFSQDVQDVVDAGGEEILCCAGDKIYKTIDGGKTWTDSLEFQGGFMEIVKDTAASASGALYAVATKRDIFSSSNKGATWAKITTKPVGNTGQLFAFNGILYVSQSDGLYTFRNGAWSKAFDQSAYSYKESYDGTELYVGFHNALYKTVLGDVYTLVYSFGGYPLSVYLTAEQRQLYGYAYNSISNTFHFNQFTYLSDDTDSSVLVDCDRWLATQGSWDADAKYEIFIDNKLVLSTINGTDKRSTEAEYFTVDPATGILDFGARNDLATQVEIYDSAVHVASVSGFSVGDRVVVDSTLEPEPAPSVSLTLDADFEGIMSSFSTDIEEWGKRYVQLKEMITYGTITSISGNYIFLDSRFDRTIELPAYIRKIPRIEGSTEIKIDIYDPQMINIGDNTHEQVEDSLSTASDLRPYQFNNSYLSNLLQLTQAVRYAYPEIGGDHKNNLYYDFHYTQAELAANINLSDSEMFSQTVYNSNFLRKTSQSINSIFIGTGTFSGNIIVGTDVGIFWSKIADGLEGNWFFVSTLPKAVFDMIITNDDTLNVATENGIYYTTDMINWTLETAPPIAYPVQRFALRWTGREIVTVSGHRATFSNDNYTSPTVGYIRNASSLYGQIELGRIIKITNAEDLNGDYSVAGVTPDEIVIRDGFSDLASETSYNGVVIDQAAWWELFDGEDYTGTADITNTLLAGGSNRISYKIGEGTWNESGFANLNQEVSFTINDIQALSNGSVLACASGRTSTGINNFIFRTTDIGSNWSTFFDLYEIKGSVVSSSPNAFGNTELTVTFTFPSSYTYVNGVFDLKTFALFATDVVSTPIAQGEIVWNDHIDGIHRIIINGQEAHDAYQAYESQNLTFRIYPMTVKKIFESDNNTVFLGTNQGIHTDRNSLIGSSNVEFGEIDRLGETGTIQGIDLQATIVSVLQDAVTGNVKFAMSSDQAVARDSLVGQQFYITDLFPVQNFEIIGNSVKSAGGEFTVDLETLYSERLATYVGKKVTVVPVQSTLYVNFDLDIGSGQFNGGKLHITSNENENLGTTYDIVSHTKTSIVVNRSIVPASTSTQEAANLGSLEAIPGQSFSVLESGNLVKFYVNFHQRGVLDNEYGGGSFVTGLLKATIDTNGPNYVILKSVLEENLVASFDVGGQFEIRSTAFEKLSSFNSKKTSTDLDHYHDLDLIGNFVSGDVSTLVIDTAGTTVGISGVEGWNDKLNLDSTLMNGARIRFYNPNIKGVSYYTTILDLTFTQMTVQTISSSAWDASAYNLIRVSPTWEWEVDASLYGYTANTYYDDFAISEVSILSDIVQGDTTIEVVSSADMVVFDKIDILDGFGTSEIHYISSITDATHIVLQNAVNSNFFIGQNARVKVLRDSFSNNHIHKVQRNEVEKLLVADYNDRGYASTHIHRCLPHLLSVNDILQQGSGDIIAVGSNSQIFKTPTSNASYWLRLTDLNDALEGGEEISSVSAATLYGGSIVAGTTNGYVFSPLNATSVVKLEKPTV